MEKTILKELGMTNNETEIYLTLLKKTDATVNEIATRSGLHRQAIYDALNRLLEKGYASFTNQNNKKHFQATKPEEILELLKEKEEKFKEIIPKLTTIANSNEEETSIKTFKGKNIFKSLYRDIRKEITKNKNKEILIWGVDDKKFLEKDEIALIQHLKLLNKIKGKEKVLIKKGEKTLLKGKQTQYKTIEKDSFYPSPIQVYANKLAIITFGNPDYLIIIKNKDVAESYRKQFKLLWKNAEEIKTY